MYRWRCFHRACARKRSTRKGGVAYARRSTKKKIAPECRACGRLMRLDRYRTTRRESQDNNCTCSTWPWSARGGPHSRSSCRAKIRRDFEESNREELLRQWTAEQVRTRDEQGRFMDDGVPF